jgi:predicted metal-dependent hydrolase
MISGLNFTLLRKPIKNLHISVLPPDGQVRISAPMTMTDTAIRMAVAGRLPWIRRQQHFFARQIRQTERQFLDGETHYLWGRAYRLKRIYDKDRKVVFNGDYLYLHTSPDYTSEQNSKILEKSYRLLLRAELDSLLAKWQPKIAECQGYQIRKMKTKWGSCNTQSHHLQFNLVLAKQPYECVEYIVVHELVHLLERSHSKRFKALLSQFLPQWESVKAKFVSL